MLKHAKVATRLPAKDLNRARTFYSEKLGLDPVEQRAGGLRYVCAAGEFAIFVSLGVQSGTHTQTGWEVDDIEATVRELRARGVEFEEYDLPGLRTVDGIAEIRGNYPSKGTGERGRVVPRQRRKPARNRSADSGLRMTQLLGRNFCAAVGETFVGSCIYRVSSATGQPALR
jgi:catechol 2,3-dioxygenase-like lactoylglutathione lyase family enzyme